ncbi:hypothetical protein [Nocardioides mangrovi]|uniref:Glycerophosphoryl diester phosphodiesterase membrane domain-containing protein n=1 Tax=Nocardioides mangrovi TaxID=2874580 RepID=A0ABS7UFK0_9ACTN|nr:hypothetical protein [Nocardioides mangrovi]MBZ5739620.1 hypothetical protein [Nocardioides mangrovi]
MGWTPQPGMLGAAHKPGAMPLRPLGLGDIYDAAFRIIRFNPRATVGSAVLVTGAAMAIPIVVTAILTGLVDLSLDQSDGNVSTAETIGYIGAFGSLGLGTVLQSIGLLFVTGMVAHVTAAAAIGRRLSLGEAWAATRGSRWRLVGLSLLLALIGLGIVLLYAAAWVVVVLALPLVAIVLFGVVTVPAVLALLSWLWIRVFYLPVPALMVERTRVPGAIGRGWALTRRQFWRTFGIALLTALITQIAASLLAVPFSIGAQVIPLAFPDSRFTVLVFVVLQSLGTVVSSAFVAPFTAAVTSLQYLDQRMRKEAYDVELMAQAGITAR